MKYTLKILALIISIFGFIQASAASKKDAEVFLKVECPTTVYVGQYVPYAVYLYAESGESVLSCDPLRVAGVQVLPHLKGNTYEQAEKIKYKGKNYVRYNISMFFLVPDEAGKYKIRGGLYNVTTGWDTGRYDFWGNRNYSIDQRLRLEAPDIEIKVKPRGKSPDNFSGAIGEYEISCTIPPGNITTGIPAIAVFTIKGYGSLNDASMPDVENAFDGNAEVKNVRRNNDVYQKGSRIYSEVTLTVTFIPEETYGEISPMEFTFFDVSKGKYRTVKSDKTDWKASREIEKPSGERMPAVEI